MFALNNYGLHPRRQNKSLRTNRNGYSPCHQNEALRPDNHQIHQMYCHRDRYAHVDSQQILYRLMPPEDIDSDTHSHENNPMCRDRNIPSSRSVPGAIPSSQAVYNHSRGSSSLSSPLSMQGSSLPASCALQFRPMPNSARRALLWWWFWLLSTTSGSSTPCTSTCNCPRTFPSCTSCACDCPSTRSCTGTSRPCPCSS